jgi:hypothetical protein
MTGPAIGRRGAVSATVALAVALMLAGCFGGERMISTVHGQAESPRLELGVNSCNRNPRATVEESDTEVRISITIDEETGNGGGDCADHAVVTLSRPLGDRSVIDASSGETLTVQLPEQPVTVPAPEQGG